MTQPRLASFVARADEALVDDRLRASVRNATDAMYTGRLRALGELADADALRDAAQGVRKRNVARLPELLEQWSDRFEANGGRVCWARTGDEAVAYVREVLRAHAAERVVKGKSMAGEEIGLNHALEEDGYEVVETDLGEFVIQLADEPPSHIIVPAIHRNRFDIADLFSADAGETIPPEVRAEADYARRRLRQAFLTADVGISGVNFAVAETGSVCLVENEGNGRLVTALPRVHIAIMGAERIVADLAELDVMLSLLGRSATGQSLTVFTNLLSGPRRQGEIDGPDELHVVVLDNGRQNVLGTEFQDALDCIRCGACLNACPVYRNVGGHAYGSVYSGPIGAVLTPLLRPDDPAARELSHASSLCGACWEACPVRIPLHDMLLDLRRRDAADTPTAVRVGFDAWSIAWSNRLAYRLSAAFSRVALRFTPPLGEGPGWLGAWLRGRTLPVRRRRP